MAKFLGVFGGALLVCCFVALIWPRFSPSPRPKPLQQLHDFLLTTPVGQNAANVLGVSDDQTVLPLTPQSISQQIINNIHTRVSDVVITHAVREISKRFRDLPIQDQEKVIEQFTKAVSEGFPEASSSPSQNLPDSTQNSTEANNNSGTHQ